MIDATDPKLSVSRQCRLLHLNRSSYYYKKKPVKPEDLKLMERSSPKKEEGARIQYVRCHKCFRRVPVDEAVVRMDGSFCGECK